MPEEFTERAFASSAAFFQATLAGINSGHSLSPQFFAA
jgi:hypothetical protein